MQCECGGPHLVGHRHSDDLVPVRRDGVRMNVCSECVLSRDVRLDKERQAWKTVQMAAEDALNALVAANEGPQEQAMLSRLIEKAQVQQKLWALDVSQTI
jgi:hypothetical protein